MEVASATAAIRPPRPLAGPEQAARDFLQTGSDGAVRIGIHDATRFEWRVLVPMPANGRLAYAIEVELEVPTNAVIRHSPWEQIQTFTRLDEGGGPVLSAGTTSDALRRGAVSLRRMLARAATGFRRHAGMGGAREAEDAEGDPYGFLVVWLETALLAVAETRRHLTQPAAGDTPRVASERALVDEYASVGLLDMLVEASRAVRSGPEPSPQPEATERALGRVRARIERAIGDEIAHRRTRGYLTMTDPSATALDTYVARAARLRRHFEEVLFLDRESYQLDERVQQWMTSFAALLAGGSAFLLQLFVLERGSSPAGGATGAMGFGVRLATIALLAGACYMTRDRIKELARHWLTGKVYRFHAQRVSSYRLPEGRGATRDVVIRTREWCDQTTQSRPDVLNPESGASLPRTRVRYLQKGVVIHQEGLSREGVRRVRHIFRYDVSPLLPRLADSIWRVPFVGAGGAVELAEAPRRYQIPISVQLRHGGHTYEERATLVLEKRGITRMDPDIAPDALDGR